MFWDSLRWPREAFFVETLAGWLLVANGCLDWYMPVVICGGFVLLVAEWMIGEDE